MTDTPLISLLVTTHNRREDLLHTLNAMIPLMPSPFEAIVVDDGSTDGTSAAVDREFPQVRLISRQNQHGLIAARNQLLGEARGDLALSLDDDATILTPDFAARVRQHFAAWPRCGVVTFRIYWGREAPPAGPTVADSEPCRVNSFVGCGHVWRMAAWKSIPPYPEWFEFHGEENHAALNLLKRGWEVHYRADVLVHHRVDRRARRDEGSPWRYRRQLRAGIVLMLLFYPLRVLPRYLGYSYWTQLRLRLLKEHNWKALTSMAWVLVDVLKKLPRIAKERAPLTSAEWASWCRLPQVLVYWEPDTKA